MVVAGPRGARGGRRGIKNVKFKIGLDSLIQLRQVL
jgi:hypothetical protein